ncbi:MAG: hypothetical protein FWD83_00295 [Promicromonosporaceae bacterium]|nr:hypothetical protein [Promicromonosporaceae bacterium]
MTDHPSADIVPKATFAPLSRTGVLGGLGKRQIILLIIAVAPTALRMFGGNLGGAFQAFFLWTLPVGAVAVCSYRGRAVLSILCVQGIFLIRKLGGQTVAIPSLRAKSAPDQIAIPGAVGERTRVLPLLDVEYGNNACLVWDANPKNPTATAVILVETEGWMMADDQVKANRVYATNELCRQIAQVSGVIRVGQWARTYEAARDQLPAPDLIDDPSPLGDFTRVEYGQMLERTQMTSTLRRDVLIGITISKKKALADIESHGGGLEGLSVVLSNRVERLMHMMPDCGVLTTNARWLGAGGVRAAIRLAFDPAAAAWLEDNGWEHPHDTPLVTYVDEARDYLVTNSGVHRSWWIERWPSTPARAGVMTELVAGGTIPRTVCQIWEPFDLHKSEKNLNQLRVARETAAKTNKMLGRAESLVSEVEGDDVETRHMEMQAGYGDVSYSGWVTVHARTVDELDQSDMWVRQAASGMNVNLCRGRQLATFVTAALPLGFRDGDE